MRAWPKSRWAICTTCGAVPAIANGWLSNEATKPTAVSIADRRRPEPQGRPGYLRVDTVHQGDWDGAKGVYHINAVDAVTQWQVVGCCSRRVAGQRLDNRRGGCCLSGQRRDGDVPALRPTASQGRRNLNAGPGERGDLAP
jgi:hypothetical protein